MSDIRDPDGNSAQRAAGRQSRRFWRGADPQFLETLEQHNARIGSPLQRCFFRAFCLYVMGPVVFLAVRLLFRFRVVGLERIEATPGRAILACQHFFEWDPFFVQVGALWTRFFYRPSRLPYNLGGHFWVKTRMRRAFSWWVGLIGIRRGGGSEQDALRRASEILNGSAPGSIAIYPTGPVGRAAHATIKPGVAFLSLSSPEVPVVPVAVLGLRELCFRDVFVLRRPAVTVVIGEPFRARDLSGERQEQRVEDVCRRIERFWKEAEALVGELEPEGIAESSPLGFEPPVEVIE
jgi:1-acyl-sn-glycerol-3-phosphate acyltransferase